MRTFLSCFSLFCLLSSLCAQVPDSSFGKNGKTISQSYFRPYVEVHGGYVQPGGRVLVSGDDFEDGGSAGSSICAFRPDGSVDNTFGKHGVAELFGLGGGFIGKQSDNKIIAVGTQSEGDGHNYIVVQRLTEDGQYDFSFGSNSKTTTNHGYDFNLTYTHCMTVDPADNIYVGGSFNSSSPVYDPENNKHITVIRYKPDGALDSSFWISRHNHFEQDCRAINVLADGSLVASYLYDTLDYISACLIKYHPDGSIDKSFGKSGIVLFDNKGSSDGNYVILHTKVLPDGSLLSVSSDADTTLVLYKVLPNGQPDGSFGNKGVINTKEPGYNSDHSFDVEPSGKILLPVSPCGIKRFLPDGSVDNSFGKNGTVVVAYSNQYAPTCELALALSNGFFALGSVTDFNNGKYAAAKFKYVLSAADEVVKQASLIALSNIKVSVYPNPAHQFLRVSSLNSLPSQLRITDMNGKTVMAMTANSRTQCIDISRLSSGMYFLKIGKESGAIGFIKE